MVVAAAGGGWFYSVRDNIEQSPSVSVPLTTYPGRELSPVLSPDGNQVTFTWNGDQHHNFDIYVKQLGTYTAHRLSSNPNPEYSPAWSPDGRRIAFLRDLEGDRAAIILISGASARYGRPKAHNWSIPWVGTTSTVRSLFCDRWYSSFGD